MTLFLLGVAALTTALGALAALNAKARNLELDNDIREWLEARQTADNPNAPHTDRFTARRYLNERQLNHRHYDRMMRTAGDDDHATRIRKLAELRLMRQQGHGR